METTLESHLTYYRQLKQCHKLVICKSVKLQLKGVSVPHNKPYGFILFNEYKKTKLLEISPRDQ